MPAKQPVTRQQKLRLEELERNLFGSLAPETAGFGREAEEQAARLPSNALQNGDFNRRSEEDPTLIIWEDKRPANVTTSEEEDDQEDDQGEDSSAVSDNDAEGIEGLNTSEEAPAGEDLTAAEQAKDDKSLEESGLDDDSLVIERRSSGKLAGPSQARQPVWEDPEDEAVEVDIAAINRLRKLRASEAETLLTGKEYAERLRQQHAKLNARTSWASLDKKKKRRRQAGSDDDSDLDEALEIVQQGASNLLQNRAVLSAGLLEATRLKDANIQEPSKATVQSVEFHPSGQLLLTAGLDKALRFFSIDGIKNPHVQTVHLADLPIHKAAFAVGGSQVLAAGRRKHFYVIDLASSKVERISHLTNREEKSLEHFAVSASPEQPLIAFLGARGHLPLVSLRSKQVIAQLKMSGTVKSATFTEDGMSLLASGGDGVIHAWDLRTRKCFSRFVDEGTIRGISLASSPGQHFLAAGSDAGFVNIYNHKAAIQAGMGNMEEPTAAAVVAPLKSLKNLVTPVDNLVFSPDGQILAMASKTKKDALRMVHTATMTTFSNWPTSRSPFNLVHSMAFSPNGGFFAAGNSKGKVLLYRMHHYQQA